MLAPFTSTWRILPLSAEGSRRGGTRKAVVVASNNSRVVDTAEINNSERELELAIMAGCDV